MPAILLLNRSTLDLRAWEWLGIKRALFPDCPDHEFDSGVYRGYVPLHPRDHQEQCEIGKPTAILVGEADLAPAKEAATRALIAAAPHQLHITFARDRKTLIRLVVCENKIAGEPLSDTSWMSPPKIIDRVGGVPIVESPNKSYYGVDDS